MTLHGEIAAVFLSAVCAALGPTQPAQEVQIAASIVEIEQDTQRAKLAIPGELWPLVGDQVKFWGELAGGPIAVVGTWIVVEMDRNHVWVEPSSPPDETARLGPSYTAMIHAPNPVGRGGNAADTTPPSECCDDEIIFDPTVYPPGIAGVMAVYDAYDKGTVLLESNPHEAIAYFRWAAENRYVLAQEELGKLFDAGEKVERDQSKAEHWYRMAARTGSTSAREWMRRHGLSWQHYD